ncbi:hypothetical protein [Roseicella sp. DB1501]|uniref:hypothetical protein n=1 Tax=Roseicella sp. DB1501 TaxID=2730925 RepID=UPI0014912ECD|nr:hypothetical protein [Roseicella sp. DB1501]NOG69876.1 hypothetical protein [Roseicella sp. DB1501]
MAVAPSLPGDAAGAASQDAMQDALAIYLYALGLVADGAPLPFRAAAFAPLPAAAGGSAGQAVAELGAVLQAAADEQRLRPMIRAADAPVQALVATLLARRREGEAYRLVLLRIGEGHALLAAAARGPLRRRPRETARAIREAEDALRRAAAALPPARPGNGAIIAATVQP